MESDGYAIEAYRIPTAVFNAEDLEHYINMVISTTQDSIGEGNSVTPKLTVITDEAKYIMNAPSNSDDLESFIEALQERFPVIKAIVYVNEQWKITVDDPEQYEMYIENPSLVADNPLKDEVMVVYAKGLGVEYWFHINFCRDDTGKVVWQEMSQVDMGSDSPVYDEVVLALRGMV